MAEDVRRLAHGQVCYLQMPAADSDRAAAFYDAPPAPWPQSWDPEGNAVGLAAHAAPR
jgi:hypothetical protein